MIYGIQQATNKVRNALIQVLRPRKTVYSRGLKFSLMCDNWITYYRWKVFNEKEPLTLNWIDKFIKDGRIFFDVGANIGVFSIYAALRHPTLKVFAFEPEYSNLHLLKENLVNNNLFKRISPFSIGLDKKCGLSYLNVQDPTPGAALHTVSEAVIHVTREGKKVLFREGIVVCSLDQFCEYLGVYPNFMKIDVDGTEREILEGGIKTFSSSEFQSLIIECKKDEVLRKDCNIFLEKTGLKKVFEENESRCQIWMKD